MFAPIYPCQSSSLNNCFNLSLYTGPAYITHLLLLTRSESTLEADISEPTIIWSLRLKNCALDEQTRPRLNPEFNYYSATWKPSFPTNRPAPQKERSRIREATGAILRGASENSRIWEFTATTGSALVCERRGLHLGIWGTMKHLGNIKPTCVFRTSSQAPSPARAPRGP